MRAIVVDRLMEPAELRVSHVDAPKLWPGTVAVDVRAAGCNFFDILMCQGRYQVKPAFPFIPGAEAAGVVAEVAGDVKDVGCRRSRVASTPLGAFAERVVVSPRAVWKMPGR
jgi:NADPH2:quinone reductase